MTAKNTKKNLENKPLKETIPWRRFWTELWRLLRSFRRPGTLALSITLVAAVLDLFKPYILKLLVDGLNGFTPERIIVLIQLIIFYLATDEVRSFIQYLNDRLVLRILVDVEYFLGMKAQETLMSLSLGYHEKENTGSKIFKIEKGVDKISEFLNNFFWEVVPTLFQMLFTTIALFWADWRLGLSFVIFTPIFIVMTYWANKRMYPIRKDIYRDYEIVSGKMGQSIININAVQSFVQENRELAEFDKVKVDLREKENKQWGWMMKINMVRNFIVDTGRAAILFLGVYLVYQNLITIGTLVFALSLSETAYGSLFRLSRFYDKIEEGREGINRLIGLFNTESEIINKSNGLKPKNIKGEIEFKDVVFYYSENRRPAVSHLNFKVEAGCTIALVGPSGGGKTTVARLIYRHYDPQVGEVLLDGRNLRDYDIHSFRKFLAIVPQEVEIFDLSVAENIAYSKPKATMKEIKAAARIANAEEFIKKLEDGYETMVGERGVKLSGGQRQRLGIARAILANPKILIFDEATSNLDSQSEALIQDSMRKISRDRTMIIIAHRLSTIKKADKIIVLENGQIAEEGSHAELSQVDGGLYAKLIKLQAMGDVD